RGAGARRPVRPAPRPPGPPPPASRPRHYVLATGGIENARLLLCSDSVVRGGLGNGHDLVGRFFLEHVAQVAGSLLVISPPGTRGFPEGWGLARARPDRPGLRDLFFVL